MNLSLGKENPRDAHRKHPIPYGASEEHLQPEEYDLVILGDGTGSTLAAWTFASERKRVAVVERKFIGGSCPNIACLPSKNIIDSAKIATYFRGAESGGIAKPGSAED